MSWLEKKSLNEEISTTQKKDFLIDLFHNYSSVIIWQYFREWNIEYDDLTTFAENGRYDGKEWGDTLRQAFKIQNTDTLQLFEQELRLVVAWYTDAVSFGRDWREKIALDIVQPAFWKW